MFNYYYFLHLQDVPPKKNRIVLAELLKQTALQTLKTAASLCNAAEFAENSMRLPQRQITNAGYVLPSEGYNYVPEPLTTSKGGFNYGPEVINNYLPRKEVLTNYVPRKEVVTNYVPEVLSNFVPRNEFVTNYLSDVPNNFLPRKEVVTVTNYVPEVLGNFVPRKEVVTSYVPRKDVYNGYSTNLLANKAIGSYF